MRVEITEISVYFFLPALTLRREQFHLRRRRRASALYVATPRTICFKLKELVLQIHVCVLAASKFETGLLQLRFPKTAVIRTVVRRRSTMAVQSTRTNNLMSLTLLRVATRLLQQMKLLYT